MAPSSLLSGLALVASASAKTPFVTLRNGVEMPLLAAGVWQYNSSEAEASIENAIKAGFNMVDTAWDYHNQDGVGRAIRNSGVDRKDIFVETKVPGCGLDAAVSTERCYEDTKTTLQKDLDLLNVSYVDLVILHFPPKYAFLFRSCHLFVCDEIVDQWRAMEEFYAAGKARAIGVSNYCPSCFECLAHKSKVAPMVNQVGYHIGMGPDNGGFKSYGEKHGCVMQAYSSLGGTPISPWSKTTDPRILHGEFTTGLARAHNKSTIQVALKWLMQNGIPAVTKSSSLAHLQSDVDLWSWNLTDAEMEAANKFSLFGLPSFACNFAQAESELLV